LRAAADAPVAGTATELEHERTANIDGAQGPLRPAGERPGRRTEPLGLSSDCGPQEPRRGDVPGRRVTSELAAERLLARQPRGRAGGRSGEAPRTGQAVEPVALVLDADRGAAAGRQTG